MPSTRTWRTAKTPAGVADGEFGYPGCHLSRIVSGAVLRYTGDRSPAAVTERTDELLDVLRDKGIKPTGEAVSWFYDPPWTIPWRRRNEVAVPV